MQQVIASFGSEYRFLDMPAPEEWVMPGVRWGYYEHPLTPAFWVSQAWMADDLRRDGFQLGRTLAEEVAACLLGGHGIPAEVGLAAYARVRDELHARATSVLPATVLENLLLSPLTVGGRQIHYRFARQRARYLAGALEKLQRLEEISLNDIALRDALCTLPGIGPKTASWIVRNRRSSDAVAILDVHIVRACTYMGVFSQYSDPARRYRDMEGSFLTFCARTNTRASVLDAVMWGTMRTISARLMRILLDDHTETEDKSVRPRLEGGRCRAARGREATGRATPRAVEMRAARELAEAAEALSPILV